MCTVQQILFRLCKFVFGQAYLSSRDAMMRSIMQETTEGNMCIFAWVMVWGASLGYTSLIWSLLTWKKHPFLLDTEEKL